MRPARVCRDEAGPPALGKMFQAVTSGDDLDRHPARGGRIFSSDVVSDAREVIQSRAGEDYPQGGLESSAPVPQESSQRRTAS